MTTWDVFHSDRLEVERGLSTAAVRAAMARGEVRDDDLIRPAGTSSPWTRLGDLPALLAPAPAPAPPPEPEPAAEPEPTADIEILADDEAEADGVDVWADNEFAVRDEPPAGSVEALPAPARGEGDQGDGGPYGEFDLKLRAREDRAREQVPASSIELVTWDDDLDAEEYDPQEEDEAVAEFTLARGRTERVEELDLAAMVDVAFQLVLFFLVTATTVLYKSLEVPKPNPESDPPAAAAQGKSKTLDDLKDDFILVEVDPAGSVKIDREAVPSELSALVERLRSARERTGRKSMLLSADFRTPHRSAVLAYDAANEIGLGIAIARPTPPPNPGAPPAPAAP